MNQNENSGESDIIQNKMSEVNGEVQPLKRSGKTHPVTASSVILTSPLFIDHLSWGEYLNQHGCDTPRMMLVVSGRYLISSRLVQQDVVLSF